MDLLALVGLALGSGDGQAEGLTDVGRAEEVGQQLGLLRGIEGGQGLAAAADGGQDAQIGQAGLLGDDLQDAVDDLVVVGDDQVEVGDGGGVSGAQPVLISSLALALLQSVWKPSCSRTN